MIPSIDKELEQERVRVTKVLYGAIKNTKQYKLAYHCFIGVFILFGLLLGLHYVETLRCELLGMGISNIAVVEILRDLITKHTMIVVLVTLGSVLLFKLVWTLVGGLYLYLTYDEKKDQELIDELNGVEKKDGVE